MCTILFLFVYYSIMFTSCTYFVYCVFVYFAYSWIQPLAAILQLTCVRVYIVAE